MELFNVLFLLFFGEGRVLSVGVFCLFGFCGGLLLLLFLVGVLFLPLFFKAT